MPTITVENAQVKYRTEGTGPGLVLVHGVGPGAMVWDRTYDDFADRSTVILPDLSGSDPVEDDGADLTVGMLAAQVAAVIEDSGKAPVDLLGYSLGSSVAVAVAATRPELVRRLILVAGFSHPDDQYLRNVMTLWLNLRGDADSFGRLAAVTAYSRGFLNSIGSEGVEAANSFMQPVPGRLRQVDLCLRVDVRDLLPRVQAETLVIGTALDALIPVEYSREIHAAIPGSAYAEVDCGHVIGLEKPEEFRKLVRDFIHR
ncbi:alpha/beta hydrolase [Actinomadura barringtoniae]|uniref:Alpha/beta hydrolase n=1 Tax=Actinomadura barringtoniae TaxID=1427535 RepID=A0A939PJR9_9ACTN|nr:alpha/beta hydrolase [Actinomadura barringtoniae]MBO2453587.1 alpha/beta hydrolase [Actinomadura barringtoniae]